MKRATLQGILLGAAMLPAAMPAAAADYVIDTEGMHAAIQFRIKHLGFSWLYGEFQDFAGQFSFDENHPAGGKVNVTVDTTSINTNHAERDKHLRSADFLEVEKYPEATFTGTSAGLDSEGNGAITGNLTLKGETRPATLEVESVGAGDDPWGGYRRGFLATTRLPLKDFGIDYNLGPDATHVELTLSVEGVRQE